MIVETAAGAMIAQGAALALAIAMPIGPSSLLCIQRAVRGGMSSGCATGLGLATVHGSYAFTALAGAGMVRDRIEANQAELSLCAATTLLWLGLRSYRRAAQAFSAVVETTEGLRRLAFAYLSALLAGAVNPVTILYFFVAVPAMIASGLRHAGPGCQAYLVIGVFCGSALWWFALACIASRLRAALFVGRRLEHANRAMALLLVAAGVLVALPGIR